MTMRSAGDGRRATELLRSVVWVVVGLAAGLLAVAGGNSASFLPPPPPELSKPPQVDSNPFTFATPPSSRAASPAIAGRKDAAQRLLGTAQIVELILARPPDGDRLYLVQALRRELGKVKVLFRT